jgi:hypothetical protein
MKRVMCYKRWGKPAGTDNREIFGPILKLASNGTIGSAGGQLGLFSI